MTITDLLNRLSDLESHLDLIRLEKQSLLDQVIPAEVKAAIADIEVEFSGKTQAVSDNIQLLKAEITAAVVAGQKTEKGDHIQAVYTKPRVTWDSGLLEGYAVAHPELLAARKVGQASVTFRKI